MSSAEPPAAVPPPSKRTRSRTMSTTNEEEPVRQRSIKRRYINLTSHPGVAGVQPVPLVWGAANAETRGPVIASTHAGGKRNAIGANGGAYSIYRALSVAAGTLDPTVLPDFRNTQPAAQIGPYPQWFDGAKIVTMDPFGAVAPHIFTDDKSVEVLPTIAITKAHIDIPELRSGAIAAKRLIPDGSVLLEDGTINVTKAAIEPVWYLPGVAERMGVSEAELRELLFTETNGSYPELVTRTDLKVFLPPTGGMTVYAFGDVATIADSKVPLTVRVHDECNGSDVFGSDVCTCRPYLVHAIEECVRTAQQGGAGLVVYFRKEGRALGEVTKYLVYNARKRRGDRASEYFACTEKVAGVEDARFQMLMPDVLHWLGIKVIHKMISMSNAKYDAIVNSGIQILERVPLPADLVPGDAQVEIDAKVAAGYEGGNVYKKVDLTQTKGRAGKAFGIDSVEGEE